MVLETISTLASRGEVVDPPSTRGVIHVLCSALGCPALRLQLDDVHTFCVLASRGAWRTREVRRLILLTNGRLGNIFRP
ncbi:hypothetical protein ATCV1_z111R [Acanthocystis turfacea chlorella virus 1]|uniref:Uncharacterized protein z111R n=1 Tax=Chlorovirus heliozoae TaxID=322019 RepID=A7K871_9PHYC|nr:hypothetical protein ATCV1_z111R [Acanthocystis turfacea chlorella virus 1]ABT16245.1 hypothetical protein ATCV1_z111R [Acanthocystis turfacea chlorella virus 1]